MIVNRKSLVRDERGGMYAEAIIVLPVFILVWTLIIFVKNGYDRTLSVGTQTRGAGWAHVMGQCKDDVAAPVEKVSASTPFSGLASLAAGFFSGGARLVTAQPTLLTRYEMLSFTFETNRYQQSDSIERPTALGGSARLGHQIDLMCDESQEEINLSVWITAAFAVS